MVCGAVQCGMRLKKESGCGGGGGGECGEVCGAGGGGDT